MSSNSGSSSTHDSLLLQTLMSRLQLRPPYLDTNSFLSQSLDDFILPTSDEDEEEQNDIGEEEEDDDDGEPGDDKKQRKLIYREEAKLEKEIIKIVHSGKGHETLRANSGQSVSIGDHNICVGVHEDESGSEYRVWEWHGHIMLFDEVDGYSAEYIYGNYFERLTEKKVAAKEEEVEEEEEEEEESKVKGEGSFGLRDLIEGLSGSVGGIGGRVVHRNSLNAAK
ncbi:uncharacterized protein M6B38_189290 [Iris pallida]|uniref:Uncharacterized protein n=1 Tax=Iris pallida TaxID=29817 RepID=A0AAX6EIC7_IRIPA|nr:uncharacterized protein M6B38_189290 [Iris pallida]